VWQTFGYGVSFGNCYIERGHIGIANVAGFNDYGREHLTIPEGLDIGNEYRIVEHWSRQISSSRGAEGSNPNYSIMVLSTVALDADPGTIDAPNLESATGSEMENLPNGAEIYMFESLSQFKTFMSAMSDKPWITQGIISITAIPHYSEYDIGLTGVIVGGVAFYKVKSGSLTTKKYEMRANWRTQIEGIFPERYRHLKKFWTFPYMVLELTTNNGTPLVLKPESWNDPGGNVVEVPHFAPPGARLVFYPYGYNKANVAQTSDSFGILFDGGEFLDMATGIFNFPTFSIVNNGYMSFMAANTHGIAYQHSSADWSQQRALTGNQLSYDQASSGMELSEQLNRLGINAATQSTGLANETAGWRALQGGINAGMSGAAGGAKGGPVGAATGALLGVANQGASWAIEINQNNKALGISTGLSNATNRAQVENQGYVRDTNKSYADYAAKGDYQNTIAAINAKVQDAKLIQPTTAGQVGGDAFNLATYGWRYDVKVKLLNYASMTAIGEYWLRYGYQVNKFGRMPASLMVMENFTYWKLRETYITSSSCPETFKQAIRGIFEKGVTVWAEPSDIGNIDIGDNSPLEGVFL
jgi:hypothetical protein